MFRSFAVLVCLVVAAGVYASPTAAEANPKQRARHAFQAGQRAFEQGSYEQALRHFKRALEISPHDAVRFNIAVCLERLDRPREAIEQYRAAARSDSLSPEARARARQQARRVRKGLQGSTPAAETNAQDARGDDEPASGVQHAREGAATQPGGEERPPARGIGALTWVGVAVATAGVAGTVGFGVRTRRLHDDFQDMPTPSRQEEGRRMRRLTNGSIGVAVLGAALTVLDLAWLARQRPEAEQSQAIRLRPSRLSIRF
jgi:tetratricopeptide (TPR) repeat protein